MDLYVKITGHRHGQTAEHWAVRLRGADVYDLGSAVEEAVCAAAGAIDELVANDELARLDVRLKAPGRRRRNHSRDPDRLQGPKVGSVVDRRRGQCVLAAMARDERDGAVPHHADRDVVAWRAERRLDVDEIHIVEEPVQA